jgi:hypothetical protein
LQQIPTWEFMVSLRSVLIVRQDGEIELSQAVNSAS